MAYCGPRGIPYRWFTGQSKVNEWDEVSSSAAIAWQDRESDRCPSCGTYESDWKDDAGDELRDPPLIVTVGKCLGCEAMDMWQADLEGAGKKMKPGERPTFQFLPDLVASDDETVTDAT